MHQNKLSTLRYSSIAALTIALFLPAMVQADANGIQPVAPTIQETNGGKTLLRLRAPAKPYLLTLSSTAKASIIGEQRLTMHVTVTTDFRFESFTADDIAPAAIPVRITVVNAKYSHSRSDGMKIDYDSKNPPKQVPAEAEIISLLPGTGFDAEFDSTGRLKRVRNIEQAVEKMLDKMKVKPENRKDMRGIIMGSLGDNAFKNIGNVLAAFSPKPVGIGDRWRKADPVSANDPLFYDTLCTLAVRENGIATINVKSAIRPDPKRKNPGPVYAPQGTQVGTYHVDEATGQTRRSELKQYLTAHMDEFGQFAGKSAKGSKFFLNNTFTVETSDIE